MNVVKRPFLGKIRNFGSMKRAFLIIGTIAGLAILMLSSCAKATTDPEKETNTNNGGATSTTEFKWTPGSGSTVTSDSSYCYNSITSIFAFKNGTNNSIEITLSSMAVGAYSVSASTGNALTYVSNSTTYTAKSGAVNITTNANNKLSGNFNCSVTGGTLTSLSGQFTDVPVR